MSGFVSGAMTAAVAGYVAYDVLSAPSALEDGELTLVVADLVFAPRLQWHPQEQCLYVADEWGRAVWRQRFGVDRRPAGHAELVLRTAPGRDPRAVVVQPDGTVLVGTYQGVLFSVATGQGPHEATLAVADLSAVERDPLMDAVADGAGGVYCAGSGSRIVHVPRLAVRGSSAVLGAASRAVLLGGAGQAAERGDDLGPRVVASGLVMPWGLALTPDGRKLVFTQSRSSNLWACSRDPATGRLSGIEVWAELPGAICSGLCLDAEGCAWVSVSDVQDDAMSWNCLAGGPVARKVRKWRSAGVAYRGGFVRVREGGKVLQRVLLRDRVGLGCALGGQGGRTLFMAVAKGNSRELRSEYAQGNSFVVAMPVPVGAPGSAAVDALGSGRIQSSSALATQRSRL